MRPVQSPRELLRSFNAFRREQRQRLHESNHPRFATPGGRAAQHPAADPDPGEYSSTDAREDTSDGTAGPTTDTGGPGPAVPSSSAGRSVRDASPVGPLPPVPTPHHDVRYGAVGRPFDRHSPFYFGFFATIGGLLAWMLFRGLGQLTTTFTILIVAFFLTLALDPMVQFLVTKGLSRAWSVLVVFAGVIAACVLIGVVVVPPVVSEGSALLGQAPEYFNQVVNTPWIQQLDQDYQVFERAQGELTKRIQDGSLVGQLFGGVLGAGKVVVNGVFQFLTVLILTLYFLATLPRMKQAAYAAVPASRRPRIMSLSEEIMRRAGAYAAGQGVVATINGICSFILMSIIGIPYPAVLAVVVGLLGLIPMVGATLGAGVVTLIALLNEPKQAVIVLVYYVIYQQIENYVIVPRIMTSTVSVPGALTVVAALAGGTLLGVIGALLAIPVAAGLLLIYEEVLLPRQAEH